MSIYYDPNEYNVTIIHAFDAYEENYDFDILLVVRDRETGTIYAATDSGCSCPVPFEYHKYPTDFAEVRSWEDVKSLMDACFPLNGYRNRKPHDSLRRAVQKALP